MKTIYPFKIAISRHFLCFTLLLALVACSDKKDELQDFLTPATPDSEIIFAQGLALDNYASEQRVNFKTGTNWTATLSGDHLETNWCTISPTKGEAGRGTVAITIAKNDDGVQRTAQLTIASGSQSKQISITQSARPVLIPEGLSYVPSEANADQPLAITFKASPTSALYGHTGEVYIHTGVISEGAWLFVPAPWEENIGKCKMTATAPNVWSINFSPTIRQWFASAQTPVKRLGIVVRNADGTKKGIETDSFIEVTDAKYTGFVPAAVKNAPRPANVEEGINIVNNSTVTLVLYDKDKNNQRKDFAHVVGDFNNWTLSNDDTSQMYRDEATHCWWITLAGLDPTREYAFQYYVGSKESDPIRLADAYSEKILDPDNDKYIPTSVYSESTAYPEGGRGIVSVFKIQKDSYNWAVNDFKMAQPEQLVIYELLLRDFTATNDLKGAMSKLPYLKEMGVNAIELMPVQEFDGNDSWGYNPCFFFAMDKAYGTKTAYKQFVDACHQAGIGVILDVVYNHATGSHPFAKLYWNSTANKTASNNPYFNVDAPHPYSVFHDFNHGSALVRNFVKRNLKFLLQEYRFDGFRFDLTKGFTQKSSTESTASTYDASRIGILKEYNDAIKQTKSDAYVILEHFCANTEERELAEAGMYLWRNINGAYCQTAMGFNSDSSFGGLYEKTPAWVGFMESHDEERAAYKQTAWGDGILKTDLSARMKQLAVNSAFFLTVPGPKMIWQFGEMGYDVSIDEGGRTGRKPIRWEYLDNAHRKALHEAYTKLLKLRNTHPALFAGSATLTWKVGTADWSNGRSLLVESITGEKLVVVGNFTKTATEVTFPGATGNWTNYLTGKNETVGTKVGLLPREYAVYTNF